MDLTTPSLNGNRRFRVPGSKFKVSGERGNVELGTQNFERLSYCPLTPRLRCHMSFPYREQSELTL
jgi:hypothetical protein